MPFEFAILDFIHGNMTNHVLDALMTFITSLGNGGIIWIIISAVMIITKKYRKTGIKIAVSLIFSFLVCNLCLKPIIARTRPFELKKAAIIIPPPSDYSFPSGHTAASFAASVTLIKNKRSPFSVCALILAFLIAFSRLYLYVHFPTDVFSGMILGTAFSLAADKLVDKFFN